MQLSLQYIRSKLIKPFKSEAAEIAAIEKIFHIFNFERERIAEYTQTSEFVSAYTLYYLSTNIAKWQACLNRLPEVIQDQINKSQVIEIGTGPGTFALAASFSENFNGSWHGVDQSKIMLEQAQEFFEDREDQAQYHFSAQVPSFGNEQPVTLLFTHSLNEMSLQQAQRIIGKVKADLVIWIEPGTKDFFEKAHQLRSSILEEDFQVITPCLGTNSCPAAMIEGEWCHQVLNVTHPADIERLCQKLSRDRRTMPVSFHVYSKSSVQALKNNNDQENNLEKALVFRMRKTQKHAQDMQVCNHEQKLEGLEVSFRGLSRGQKKEIQAQLAGEVVEFELLKELDGKRRVKLSE